MVANQTGTRVVATVIAVIVGVVPASGVPHSHEPIRMSDYRFEFSLFPDTIIPYQILWLKVVATNVAGKVVPDPTLVSAGIL
jgi:hypothetical protein